MVSKANGALTIIVILRPALMIMSIPYCKTIQWMGMFTSIKRRVCMDPKLPFFCVKLACCGEVKYKSYQIFWLYSTKFKTSNANFEKKAASELDFQINIIRRPFWIFGMSRELITCAINQIKRNVMLNSEDLMNLCDWINCFKATRVVSYISSQSLPFS